jgi:hypothetical protein
MCAGGSLSDISTWCGPQEQTEFALQHCCGSISGIPVPVPSWRMDPGSRIPDLWSRIPNPYFWGLSDNVLRKSTIILCELTHILSVPVQILNIFFTLWYLWIQNRKNNFVSPRLLMLLLDRGSAKEKNQDPDPQHCIAELVLTLKLCLHHCKMMQAEIQSQYP